MNRQLKRSFILKSPKATLDFAAQIGQNLKGGELIAIASDLGGGKTTFVRGLTKGAGSTEHVTSPSFTIRNDYSAKNLDIAHFDFYRINDPGILRDMLEEVIDDSSVSIVIVWAGVVS